ncbi:Gfo/Idh/MocA family protein [Streptomyces minutiscleroticus]|uniref:Gfo/Idh/MocA family protein n=1 Tax=Streptomyces minutiscleroticus TaxID=68238 RepID=UPI00332808D2
MTTDPSSPSPSLSSAPSPSSAPSSEPSPPLTDPSSPWPHSPVRVGLVGSGPWARGVHAPVLAAGPETRLTAVWARRPEAARETATPHGAAVAATFDELLDGCEAVAFAVPPAVQAGLAPRAARAGRALLLEKPLAADLESARRVADAVAEAGVVSQMVLSNRYLPGVRRFLARARSREVSGARACCLSGAFLGGDFATPWRLEHGALLDIGPHVLDLLDAAVGTVVRVRGTGDPRRWVELTCEHANGAVSQASLSGSVAVPGGLTRVELYGPQEPLVLDGAALGPEEPWPVLRREFAAAVRTGTPGDLDARRGLHLQTLIDQVRPA